MHDPHTAQLQGLLKLEVPTLVSSGYPTKVLGLFLILHVHYQIPFAYKWCMYVFRTMLIISRDYFPKKL